MSLGFRSISGLSFNQMNDGLLTISQIPGDPGFGPSAAVITVIATGLPPNDPAITMQLFPSGHLSSGTDLNGAISATATFVNNGDDKHFSISGGGIANFAKGFWEQAVRGLCNNNTGSYGFDIQFSVLDINSDFSGTLTDIPQNLSNTSPSWDPIDDIGEVELDWQYDNTAVENPDAFAILRDGTPIGSVPWESGTVNYSFNDFVFAEGNYTYTILAYKYGAPNAKSGESNPVVVSFSSTNPDISITTDLNIDIALASSLLFITDPSGIYTLIPNQFHDTLYQRNDDTFIDVKIPDPFVKLAFIPDK